MEITNENLSDLLEQVKQEIQSVLLPGSGYGYVIHDIAILINQKYQRNYPEWLIAYACESLLSENKIAERQYYYLKPKKPKQFTELDVVNQIIQLINIDAVIVKSTIGNHIYWNIFYNKKPLTGGFKSPVEALKGLLVFHISKINNYGQREDWKWLR